MFISRTHTEGRKGRKKSQWSKTLFKKNNIRVLWWKLKFCLWKILSKEIPKMRKFFLNERKKNLGYLWPFESFFLIWKIIIYAKRFFFILNVEILWLWNYTESKIFKIKIYWDFVEDFAFVEERNES